MQQSNPKTTDIVDALRDRRHAGHLNQAAADEIIMLRERVKILSENIKVLERELKDAFRDCLTFEEACQ